MLMPLDFPKTRLTLKIQKCKTDYLSIIVSFFSASVPSLDALCPFF